MTDPNPAVTGTRPLVLLGVRDHIATVSFNRPERHNAVDNDVAYAFTDILRELHERPGLRAVILRGEGKSFSSGRDTKALGGRPGGETDLEFVAKFQKNITLISTMPVPVIAALKGWVLGGSFERALHCDVRIAATDAKMALPEVGHGLVPDTGGVSRLRALAGSGMVKDLVLTGRTLTAEEALTAGIVSRVVPPERLDDEAWQVASLIASRSPLAVRLARQIIDDLDREAHASALRQENLAQALLFASEDYREGKAARAEGRQPEFRGR